MTLQSIKQLGRVRTFWLFAAVTLCASLCYSSLNPLLVKAAVSTQNTAKISFTFDDGIESAILKAAPTLQKYGLTGTDYIITNCVGLAAPAAGGDNGCAADGSKAYMTWAEITQLQNTYHWEIGSHTVDHHCMASSALTDPDNCLNPAPLTAAELETELAGSQQTLAQNGFTATDFAWPYGDYGNLSLSIAAKYYATTRGFADDDANNVFPYNDLVLHDQQFQVGAPAPTWAICADTSVAGAEKCIDNAIAASQWVILVFHNITDTPATTVNDYDESTANLDAIAAYAAAKQTAGLAKVINVNQGVATGTNMFANGDFATGIASGWTTDDPTDIIADANNNGRYPEPTHSVLLKGNPSGADNHLYSPEVAVTAGQTYVLKNYVNLLSGGSVNFYIDEYDATGVKLTGVDPKAGISYGGKLDVADVNFTYTPSVGAAFAQLQVIVKGATTQAYYDGAQFFNAVPTKPGDANGDGLVNIKDATLVSLNWGKTGATLAQGDLNGDGLVNIKDATLVSLNWGK